MAAVAGEAAEGVEGAVHWPSESGESTSGDSASEDSNESGSYSGSKYGLENLPNEVLERICIELVEDGAASPSLLLPLLHSSRTLYKQILPYLYRYISVKRPHKGLPDAIRNNGFAVKSFNLLFSSSGGCEWTVDEVVDLVSACESAEHIGLNCAPPPFNLVFDEKVKGAFARCKPEALTFYSASIGEHYVETDDRWYGLVDDFLDIFPDLATLNMCHPPPYLQIRRPVHRIRSLEIWYPSFPEGVPNHIVDNVHVALPPPATAPDRQQLFQDGSLSHIHTLRLDSVFYPDLLRWLGPKCDTLTNLSIYDDNLLLLNQNLRDLFDRCANLYHLELAIDTLHAKTLSSIPHSLTYFAFGAFYMSYATPVKSIYEFLSEPANAPNLRFITLLLGDCTEPEDDPEYDSNGNGGVDAWEQVREYLPRLRKVLRERGVHYAGFEIDGGDKNVHTIAQYRPDALFGNLLAVEQVQDSMGAQD